MTQDLVSLTITNIDAPFKPCKDYPPAKLILQKFSFGNSVKIIAEKDINKNTMFGGNFAATSDSRFYEAIEKMLGHNFYGAIPIHDRIE